MKNYFLLLTVIILSFSSCRKDNTPFVPIQEIDQPITSFLIGDSTNGNIQYSTLNISLQGDCYFYLDINNDSINDMEFSNVSGEDQFSAGGASIVSATGDSLFLLGYTDSNNLRTLNFSDTISCNDFEDNLPCVGVFTTNFASSEQPETVYNGPWQNVGIKYFAFKFYDPQLESWSLGWFEVESFGGASINIYGMGVVSNTACL